MSKDDYRESRTHKLPVVFTHQIQIDYIAPCDPTDTNPDWQLGYPGYCRPNTLIPCFWSYSDYTTALGVPAEDYNRDVQENRATYVRYYQNMLTKTKPAKPDNKWKVIWQDIQTLYKNELK